MDFIIKKDADKKAVTTYIDRLPNCKEYDIHIETRKIIRPDNHSAIYGKWLGIMSAHTGDDINDIHDFLRQKFLGFGVKRIYGEEILKEVLVEDLGERDLTYYLEKVEAYAAVEWGIVLPHPEDIYWSIFDKVKY